MIFIIIRKEKEKATTKIHLMQVFKQLFVCLFICLCCAHPITHKGIHSIYSNASCSCAKYMGYPPLLNVICRAQFNICQSNFSVNNIWAIWMSHIGYKMLHAVCIACTYTYRVHLYIFIHTQRINFIVDTAFKMLYNSIHSIDLNNFFEFFSHLKP